MLTTPGETDVSVFVDFAALRQSVVDSKSDSVSYGPLEQRYLLKALGIDARMEQLIQTANEVQHEHLKSGYERMIGSAETGQREGTGRLYKAMVICHKDLPRPVGF